jgi:Xaa-Pro aminopeptidase
MFLSDEPGFYKAGDFGIRIENDIEVIMANKSTYDNTQFLRFNTITLLPYERSLIDVDLLTHEQYNAINQYHIKVAQVLEPLLRDDELALRALRSRTANLTTPSGSKAPMTMKSSFILYIILVFIITFI